MKNTITCFVLGLSVCFLLINTLAFAQEEKGSIYIITTFKGMMPEGGSVAERDSLLMVVLELQKMNPKYLSVKVLRHHWGKDYQDWLYIIEYATWADIEEADKIDEENYKKKWPDKDWVENFGMFGKYFYTHSDEIYIELPKYGR